MSELRFCGYRYAAVVKTAAREIVDFRDPNYAPTSEWDKKEAEKNKNIAAFVAVGGSKIFLFNYGGGNILAWAEMLGVIRQDFSDVDPNVGVVWSVLTTKGNLLLSDDHSWGTPSRFSKTIGRAIQPLLDAGLIKPASAIYIGNWASKRGKLLGKAKEFIREKGVPIPMKMVLYHGTTDAFLEDILERGLTAQPQDQRAWKRETQQYRPQHRDISVYLTSDKSQAAYYATKAVNVLRRNGYRGVKPVVLKVTVPKRAYKNFRPDDDYLMRLKEQGDATWLESLGELSQVAYAGAVPPEWIEVESAGVGKYEHQDPLVANVNTTVTPTQRDLKRLIKWLGSNDAYRWLPYASWLSGGCWVLGAALIRVLPGSSLWWVTLPDGTPTHAVVYYNGYFIDGSGIYRSDDQLLDYWEHEEGLEEGSYLTVQEDQRYLESLTLECPTQLVHDLTALLREVLSGARKAAPTSPQAQPNSRSSTAVNTNTTGLPDDRYTQADSNPEVRTRGQGVGGTTKPPGGGVVAHGPQHCQPQSPAGPTDRAVGAAVGAGATATQGTGNQNQIGQTTMTKQLRTAQDPPEEDLALDLPPVDDPALGGEGEPSEYEMSEQLEKDPGANWRDLYLQPVIRAIRNRFDLEKGQVKLVSPKKKIPFGSDTLGFEIAGHVRFEDFTPGQDEYGKSPFRFRAVVDTNGELILPVEVTGN